MPDTSYTLKQLVSIIAPPGDRETARRIARQVRHWTALDLLSPLSDKHTGTGVSRRYSADEVRKAAILVEFARYRIPAPVLEDTFPTAAEDWPARKAWRDAIAGTRPIFLHMAYNGDVTIYQFTDADAVTRALTPKNGAKIDPVFDVVSAIVINVTRLFARLKL